MRWLIYVALILLSNFSYSNEIKAKSWLIADGNGKILEQENIEVVQPIASITKLMTAMVILDSHPQLDEISKKKFKGLSVTKLQLINLAIIRSDNTAAKMLCETYIKGYQACIDDMNNKARSLGMYDTKFEDSSGLDNRNVSTAIDLIKLLLEAEKYPEIVNASNQSVGELIKKKKKKQIKIKFHNTNPLISKYNVLVSKTGYVRASGGCLVMSTVNSGQKRLFVVLNSTTTRTRIVDMEKLILKNI